jgi:hypothetical protein
MGKAAKRRQMSRRRFLAKLSSENPVAFEFQWERRIDSWMSEIRFAAREWKSGGDASRERIFLILDEAMVVLENCGADIYGKFAKKTHALLCNECCAAVADVVGAEMYRLSNMARLDSHAAKARKSA